MRDPIVDDVDFEPIDALLEEVVRGDAARIIAPASAASVRRRGGWLAAALLLLGAVVVAGVWSLQRSRQQRAATPRVQEPQDPKADGKAPRSLDELRVALAGARSVQGQTRYVAELDVANGTLGTAKLASNPDESATLDGAEVAAFCEGMLQSVQHRKDGLELPSLGESQDGRALRLWPHFEITVGAGERSFRFGVAFQKGRASCLFVPGLGMFEATQPLADLLVRLYLEALHNGRRARGEAENLEELRELPADARSVTCPVLAAEHVRSELARFTQLERLTFVVAGITQAPTGDVIDALPRTLRELTIQGTSLTAADIHKLAALPQLAALTLEDGSPPDAIAALAAFGPRLRRLVLPWRSIGAGPVRVRVDEPPQVGIHYPNDLAVPATTWRSLAAAIAGGLSLIELSIEGDRGVLDGAEVLAQATSLRALRLSLRGPVRAADIDWLPVVASLRELSLRDCKVDDDAVPVLGKLLQLRALDLTNTAFTADGVASLRRQLPDCAITARPGVVVSPPGQVTVRKG